MQWPSYARNSVPTGLPPAWAVAIGILRVLAAGLVLLVADRTYLRKRACEPASLVVVIATWTAAGAASMVVQWAAFDYLEQPGISPLRWGVSSITFALRSALCAYYFGLRDHWVNSVAQLRTSNARLLSLREKAEVDLEDVRARVRSIIVDQVLPRVRRLQADLGDEDTEMTGGRLLRLSQIAEAYSQGVVREASHRVSGLPTAPAVDEDVALPRSGAVPVPESRQPLLISVRWSALVFGATLAPLVLTAPPDDPGVPILVGICALLGMLGLGAMIQARASNRSTTTTWTMCWTAGAVIVDVGVFAAVGQLPERLDSPVPLISLMMIVFLLAMLGASMVRHLRGIAAQAEELEGVKEQITGIYAGLKDELVAEKRRVALLLHGPVQGRLAAVAMLLKLDAGKTSPGQARGDSRERCEAILDQVVVDLTAVVEGSFDDGLPLPGRLTQLIERWRGLAEVSLNCDQCTVDAAADDPGLRLWLFEIVEEGINNAVTHGHATRIEVDIKVHDAVVEVSVRDDGVGIGGEVGQGMGLSMIGRSPARLTLRPLPLGGCQLLVSVPLSAGVRRG